MTGFQLQQDLGDEIEKILKDMLFYDIQGNLVHIKAYPQTLPKRRQEVGKGKLMPDEEMDGMDPYPFCVVRFDGGKLETLGSTNKITTELIFGVYDEALENKGHQTLLNIFEKVMERFVQDPVLNGCYRMNDEDGIEWVLNDEDWYPYIVGAMSMTWDTFFVTKKEDRYA